MKPIIDEEFTKNPVYSNEFVVDKKIKVLVRNKHNDNNRNSRI
jgi:hypothetical protein